MHTLLQVENSKTEWMLQNNIANYQRISKNRSDGTNNRKIYFGLLLLFLLIILLWIERNKELIIALENKRSRFIDLDSIDWINYLNDLEDKLTGVSDAKPCQPDFKIFVHPENRSRRHSLRMEKSENHLVPPITDPERVTEQDVIKFFHQFSASNRCYCTIGNLSYIASGWTKSVHSGITNDQPIAVKFLNPSGKDFIGCLRDSNHGDGDMTSRRRNCRRRIENKLLKEAFLLHRLASVCPHIIKPLAVCRLQHPSAGFRDPNTMRGVEEKSVAVVTELGQSIDVIKLLQMSWEDRLKVSHGVTTLLQCLSTHPLGSIAINDFRRDQFVLNSEGEVTLVDVDDVGISDPECSTTEDCLRSFNSSMRDDNRILLEIARDRVRCEQSRCFGFNEFRNTILAGREFLKILPPTTPNSLRTLVNELVSAYTSASWRIQELYNSINKVKKMYGSGEYISWNCTTGVDSGSRHRSVRSVGQMYKVLKGFDVNGDYRCPYTVTGPVCTVSVLDVVEATELCDNEPSCGGFVIDINRRTWSGRYFAHLKNNISTFFHNHRVNSYIKSQKTL